MSYSIKVRFLNGMLRQFTGEYFQVWREAHKFSREHNTLIWEYKVVSK